MKVMKNNRDICRVFKHRHINAWMWIIYGRNGKVICNSLWYLKLSYAFNSAKSFCSRNPNIKMDF